MVAKLFIFIIPQYAKHVVGIYFLSFPFRCLCVCKLFSVADFSGTTIDRILKFDTNIGYDQLLGR